MEKHWEKHLFHDDGIVPVKFKRGRQLQPLTILIVSQRRKGRPVIVPVGSILDESLRKPTSDTRLERQWRKVAKTLGDELAECRQESSGLWDGTHVVVSGRDSIVASFTASAGIMGSLSTILSLGANRLRSLFCNLRCNQQVSVKTEALNRLFDAERPLWTPNMVQFNVRNHILEDNGNFMMWVVTEVFTASELIIAKSQDAALQAGVDASPAVGDVTGCLGKAELKCFRRRDEYAVIEAPEGDPSFTYGFRALRLQYDEHGALKLNDSDMGEDQPVVRGSAHSLSAPVEDRTYHMGAFFAQAPLANDQERPDDLNCLEWDDEDDEQPDLAFTESSGRV